MPGHRGVILCADDYGLTPGVSAAILSLAAAGRLSATSALVTLPDWPAHARDLAECRKFLTVGLHLNLTLGRPLAAMPRLAPGGDFPSIGRLLRLALSGALDRDEIRAEATRQLALFEAAFGFPPDFVDGHHHVHALPGVRRAVLDALSEYAPAGGLLVRDPSDRWGRILGRPARAKALFVALLSGDLADQATRRSFVVNVGFAGFSSFSARRSFDWELDQFLRGAGPGHMIMCHPGRPDSKLAELDTVSDRRQEELDVLARRGDLQSWLWRPRRSGAEQRCDWPHVPAGRALDT